MEQVAEHQTSLAVVLVEQQAVEQFQGSRNQLAVVVAVLVDQ